MFCFFVSRYKEKLFHKKTTTPKNNFRDVPAGPVAKTLSSQCTEPRSHPWSGNYIPHAN